MKATYNKSIAYRPEVDGLRAIAVLPVILFHAGFEIFSGGFIGVDIFFVISGYLITNILLTEIEENRFSISRFYERRARRILPALFFLILSCLPFAWAWMSPDELKRFGQSIIGVSTFSSNIYFWLKTDYFSPSSEEQPLLHTWSLAVEEQYYVIFPIFLLLLWHIGKFYIFSIISILIIASLSLSEILLNYNPDANFYLLPTRSWELLLGSALAFWKENRCFIKRYNILSQNLAFIGLAVIFYSLFSFDKETPFPSLITLIPVLGTILVIAFARGDCVTGKILASKPLVAIGLISYSTYLWHQPLYAFARIKMIDEPSQSLMAILVIASLLIAYFSWKYIEHPFRTKQFNKRLVLTTATSGLLFLSFSGFFIHLNSGFESRYTLPNGLMNTFVRAPAPCFDKDSSQNDIDWICDIGSESNKKSEYLLLGDSHMYSMLPGFEIWSNKTGKNGAYVGYSGCPPLLAIHALRKDQNNKNCFALNKRIFDYVRENSIKDIILISRWTYYTNGGYNGDEFSYIGMNNSDHGNPETSNKAFTHGLNETIKAYSSIGTKVHLIAQVPQQKLKPQDIYLKAYSNSKDSSLDISRLSVSRKEHEELQYEVNSIFKQAKHKYKEKFEFIDFTNFFCNSNTCMAGNDSQSFYFDDDHLSVIGATNLSQKIEESLQLSTEQKM